MQNATNVKQMHETAASIGIGVQRSRVTEPRGETLIPLVLQHHPLQSRAAQHVEGLKPAAR